MTPAVPVIVFKGFHLAESVYPNPAERHCHDVDAILPATSWPAVARAARTLGWATTWSR